MVNNKKALLEREEKQCFNDIIRELNLGGEVLGSCPEILEEILRVLSFKFVNVPERCLLNVLIAKLAQMITAKRVKYKKVADEGFPVWYAILFMGSGTHKDNLVKNLNEHIFSDFKLWFDDKAKKYKERELEKIKELADKECAEFKGAKREERKQAFIKAEKQKIRNIICEMSNGTQEGFYSDAESFSIAGFGSLFLKISEFGLYLASKTTEKEQFLTCLYDAYEGKIASKCIKGENRKPDIENLPVNVLLYSDYGLFKSEIKTQFDNLMKTGLSRRAVVSFREDVDLQDAELPHELEASYVTSAKEQGEKLSKIFFAIDDNACYVLTREAQDNILRPYSSYLTNLHNNTENDILKREIMSRSYKALKLSCLYACLNHPTEKFINKNDMLQAIQTVEYLSRDLARFCKYRPKEIDESDLLFEFLKSNAGVKFPKTTLIYNKYREIGISRNKLRLVFGDCIESIREISPAQGYTLIEQPINNNSGVEYCLVKNNVVGLKAKPLTKILSTKS
jgi:hypothetical protein